MSRLAALTVCVMLAWTAAALRAQEPGAVEAGEPSTDDILRRLEETRASLQRSAFGAPQEVATQPSSLSEAIERLEQVRLVEPAPQTQPATQPATQPSPTTQPADPLASLKTVEAQKLSEPLAAADALYVNGRLAQAADLYEAALTRDIDPDSRAWVLFQLANCRRADDPETARGLYRRVTAEHGASPWAPLAQVQERLIEWRQTHRPEQVVRQVGEAIAPRPTTQPTTQPVAQPVPASGPART